MTRGPFSFSTKVTVRFAETDAQGIAHHSAYVVWFEVARVNYLTEFAGGYQRLRDEGVESPVVSVEVRYLQPARFDDTLTIRTRCVDRRGARFRFEYLVEHDGRVIAEGSSSHALIDAKTLRPVRMPEWLGEAIGRAEAAASRS